MQLKKRKFIHVTLFTVRQWGCRRCLNASDLDIQRWYWYRCNSDHNCLRSRRSLGRRHSSPLLQGQRIAEREKVTLHYLVTVTLCILYCCCVLLYVAFVLKKFNMVTYDLVERCPSLYISLPPYPHPTHAPRHPASYLIVGVFVLRCCTLLQN